MRDEYILTLPMTADYARLALSLGAARGYGADAILAGTRIDALALASPSLRMSQRDNLKVLDNLDRLLGPGWAFDVRFGPETSGPLGHAVATAPSVARAFETLAAFGQSRSPRYELRMGVDGPRHVVLKIVETIEVTAQQRLTGDEIIMMSLHNMLQTIVGNDVASARFRFRSPPPAHATSYQHAFRGAIDFDAPITSIEFPRAWLLRPTPFANAQLFAGALDSLEMERAALRAEGLVVSEVERVLSAHRGGSAPNIEDIAAMLGVSQRTLARRLNSAGTNFRTLRDGMLERRARQLLAATGRSVESISTELGYAEPSAFNLACHRWFGMSPRAWRKTQLAPEERDSTAPIGGA